MIALLTSPLTSLPAPRGQGKVRELYDLGHELLIITTDRISAFDVIMANGIPDKGRVLNLMSAFWFDLFKDLTPNHIITTEDVLIADRIGEWHDSLAGRCTLAKKAVPVKMECVARGYLAGSLYKEYRQYGGNVHGLDLPDGLRDGDRLPEPIFTPATKAESGHDENLSWTQAVDLVGFENATWLRDTTLDLYRRATERVGEHGIILADTKFEFGETADGIIWIDEALTPDSSRYWNAATYLPGGPQPSYDKQFVRDYLESIGFDKQPPGPALPDDIVARTREKYLEAYERIVGRPLPCS